MSRHAARRAAVQLVYEWMLGGDGETTLTDLIEFPQDDPDIGYLDILVTGVRARKAELEQAIAQRSESWTVDRIPSVVKAILYVALVELDACPDVPDSVAINEAVDMAHLYAEESDARFINGVLGNYVRESGGQ